GTLELLARGERRAVDHDGVEPSRAADVHRPLRALVAAGAVPARQIEQRAFADRGDLETDELDHLALDRVAVPARVQLVEEPERPLEGGLVELSPLDLDLVLVVLTEVPHVDRATDLRLAVEALLPQLRERALGDPRELAVDELGVDVVRAERLRPDLVDADVGQEQPERREDTGLERHDHPRDPE